PGKGTHSGVAVSSNAPERAGGLRREPALTLAGEDLAEPRLGGRGDRAEVGQVPEVRGSRLVELRSRPLGTCAPGPGWPRARQSSGKIKGKSALRRSRGRPSRTSDGKFPLCRRPW